MNIEFTCKYCLETHIREDALRKDGTPDYPEVCPHCQTTKCADCGGILKPETKHCQHCGVIDPEFQSNCVRVTSTSAAYAERNWISAVKRWNDVFGDLEDENHRFELWTNFESEETSLKEVTIEDGDKVTLSTRELSETEISKL